MLFYQTVMHIFGSFALIFAVNNKLSILLKTSPLLIYSSRDFLFIVLTDHYRLYGDPLLYYRLHFHIPVNTDYNQIIKIIF